MIRLGKCSTAVVLSLVLSLALFTTGAFAQGGNQRVEHGNISISAHKAVLNSVPQFVARGILGSAVQRPNSAQGNCGNWGWGNNCGGFTRILRCSSQRECHTVQECRWTGGVRVCRGYKVCRFRSICRRCSNNGWGGPNAWAARRH